MTKSARQDTSKAARQPGQSQPRRSPPRPSGKPRQSRARPPSRRPAPPRKRRKRPSTPPTGPRRDQAQVPRGAGAQAPGAQRGPGQGRPRRRQDPRRARPGREPPQLPPQERLAAGPIGEPRPPATAARLGLPTAVAARTLSLLRLLSSRATEAMTTAPPIEAVSRQPLAEQQRAKRHGHHRVDVGVVDTTDEAAAAARSRSRSARAASRGRPGKRAPERLAAGVPDHASPVATASPTSTPRRPASPSRCRATRWPGVQRPRAPSRCPSSCWHRGRRGRKHRPVPVRLRDDGDPRQPDDQRAQPRGRSRRPLITWSASAIQSGRWRRAARRARTQRPFRVGDAAVAEGEQHRAHHGHPRPLRERAPHPAPGRAWLLSVRLLVGGRCPGGCASHAAG